MEAATRAKTGRITRVPPHKRVIRITISLQPKIHDTALDLVNKAGFGGLSDYVSAHVRRDAKLDAFMVSDAESSK